MNQYSRMLRWAVLGCLTVGLCRVAVAAEAEPGFKSLFNGQDLTGWEGLPQFWSVKDGAITGQTTKENPTKGNTFLVWKDGETADFELRLSYKIPAGNSGIQYRSQLADAKNFVVGGYQADFEAGKGFSGILYEERGRGILAQRGQKVVITPDPNDPNKPKIEVVGTLGGPDALQSKIKANDWNEYVIIAQGNHLRHFINGHQMVDVLDKHSNKAAKSGILALQLHAGDPMTVQFKNIRLKTGPSDAAAKTDLEQVQGDWLVAEMVEDGEKVPPAALASARLKITGRQFSLQHSEGGESGAIELREGVSPRRMNITLDDGSEVLAIYEITSASSFRVCYSMPGASRPAAFRSAPGSDQVVMVFKRKDS